MNNDNKVETEIAGLNCWASYATGHNSLFSGTAPLNYCNNIIFFSLLDSDWLKTAD